MFLLNRIITTQIDRGFIIDTAKLYVYDCKNAYLPHARYYISPYEVKFEHIAGLKEQDQDWIIQGILDAHVNVRLGKYVMTLEEIDKLLEERGEVVTDIDLKYENTIRQIVDMDIDMRNNIAYLKMDNGEEKTLGANAMINEAINKLYR